LINLPTLAEKLEISLDTTQAAPQPAEPVVQQDSGVVVQKEVEADSSQEVALRWYNRAKEKISLIQYNVAERSSNFVTEYLRVENPNTGIRALVFQDQVLRTLVAPQANTTIEAHLKNIAVSDELGLKNKYVEESKRKVLLARNVLATEYEKLVYETADTYRQSVSTLEDLIEKGEGATTAEGMDYYDFQDNYIMQLVFYTNQFAKIALNQYKATLQLAQQSNINNDALLTTEQKMFNFGYEAGDMMKELSKLPAQKSEGYLKKFDETQNENYQLGSTFFDDQSFELAGYSREVFEFSYDLGKETGVENIWTQLILSRLVELDPATYLADLPKEEFSVGSDGSWLAARSAGANWNTRVFDDTQWQSAATVDLPYSLNFRAFDSLQISPAAIWIEVAMAPEGTNSGTDTLQLADTTQSLLSGESEESDTVTAYFRKKFTLPSRPIEGWIAITGDKSYHLYLNDIYITGNDQKTFEDVEVVRFDTFSNFLVEGDNLLAASVTDVDGPPHYGLRFYVHLTLLPGDMTDTIQNIKSKMGEENIDPAQLRKSGILNKNRIVE